MRFSMQLSNLFNWRVDPEERASDTISQEWTAQAAFAHPPWCLISRVVMKTQMEKATVILITPFWQFQSWFPVIIDSLKYLWVQYPVRPVQ